MPRKKVVPATAYVECQYGGIAVTGDYVLCLHKYGFRGNDAEVFPAKVVDGKCYSGRNLSYPYSTTTTGPWVNKLSALCHIQRHDIPQKEYDAIEANLASRGLIASGESSEKEHYNH